MIKVQTREDFLKEVKKHLPIHVFAVEVGVLRGDFSEMILNIVEPLRLCLIDPFKIGEKQYNEGVGFLPVAYSTDEDYEFVCRRFANEIESAKIILRRMLSIEAADWFAYESQDLVYLDGSHLLEDVDEDLNIWVKKIRQRGLLCGHDYIKHESFGVMEAVDNFCKEYNFEMVIFNENGGDYALTAIQ